MLTSFVWSISSVRCFRILVVTWLFATWVSSLSAKDEKWCEGVGYAQRPSAQYSHENLRKRLKLNPGDVDALINLGIHLEEQGQSAQAYALYERAIQAKPDCYLGYYFAGLVEDRISRNAASEAEAKIYKALSLDASVQTDPNIQGFMRAHPRRVGGLSSTENESPSVTNQILSSSDRFLAGVGVGLLLATPFLYLARRKRSASG